MPLRCSHTTHLYSGDGFFRESVATEVWFMDGLGDIKMRIKRGGQDVAEEDEKGEEEEDGEEGEGMVRKSEEAEEGEG